MKTIISSLTKIFCFLTITSLFWHCTSTTTSDKTPEFITNLDTLSATLSRITVCEHMDVQGSENKTNGKVTSELAFKLINVKYLAKDNDSIKNIGKQIAIVIKQALRNQNEFDKYKIIFITKEVTHSALGDVTKENYKSVEFDISEL